MSQQEMYYRPPSEADSFIVRVMRGCPHNACTFCNTFREIPCKALPVEEITAGMDQDVRDIGPQHLHLVKSMYLEGGDPLALRTGRLLAIMAHARRVFPALERFACYASARFTVKKKAEELAALSRAGLRRVFVGLESGSDAILRRTNKRCTTADLLQAGTLLGEAGIEMDVSMMLGIGGVELSSEHARATADLINRIRPVCVRVRTFAPKSGTELGREYLNGSFHLPGPHAIMRELRQMVGLVSAKTRLYSEHWTNFVLFDAMMPEAKEPLLEHIDQHLAMPESDFRPVGLDGIKD
jgi:radical SAM superfamily enzyme YgiQ (UPF0313 family)